MISARPSPAVPPPAGCLVFAGYRRRRSEISMTYEIGGRRLEKTYRYGEVDFYSLEERYGRELLERIYFHLMAAEALPLVSLAPASLDFGPFQHLVTAELVTLWRRLLAGIGAQWRYQNGRPFYDGPELLAEPATAAFDPVAAEPGPVEALSFNGGGKDSLVTARLLEKSGISYASYGYLHSAYGSEEAQQKLIGNLLAHCSAHRGHWLRIDDPIWRLSPRQLDAELGVRHPISGETPISIFGVLPVVLQHGYRYLVLGNERSADSPNFRWEVTGEEVNHQWGKSLEAELLVGDYIRRHLVSNVSYFSALKPIHDVLIFNLLRTEDAPAVQSTHSCNEQKPWCEECPKCAYVWAGFRAYLPEETVVPMFEHDLFEHPGAQEPFRQLLGLGDHRPFECVGEIPEARLAFEICRRRGFGGAALEMYAREAPPLDLGATLDRYLTVREELPTVPPEVGSRLFPHLLEGAADARAYIESHFD